MLSILIAGVFIAVVAIYPLFIRLKKDVEQNFLDTVKNRKMIIEQFIDRQVQTTWQITSRTKAREMLEKYNRGQADLQELADYCRPIMEDALRLSKEAVGCLRFDKNGEPVVQTGQILPESFRVKSLGKETGLKIDGPIFLSDGSYLVIGAPILDREKIQVGRDLVLFKLEELEKIVHDRTGLGETGEVILGMVVVDTLVRVFSPLGKNRENQDGNVDINSPTGMALREASRLDKDAAGLFTPSSDPPEVFAGSGLSRIDNWVLVVRKDTKELYSAVNRQVILIVLIVAAILILDVLGTGFLLKYGRCLFKVAVEAFFNDKPCSMVHMHQIERGIQ